MVAGCICVGKQLDQTMGGDIFEIIIKSGLLFSGKQEKSFRKMASDKFWLNNLHLPNISLNGTFGGANVSIFFLYNVLTVP